MIRQRRNKKIVLGITGAFGSGKSTVAAIFGSFHDKVIDADRIAHRLVSPGQEAYKKIVRFFGLEILKKDRQINRDKLAEVVFKDRKLLCKLNAIMHPRIIRRIREGIKKTKQGFVIVDAPLLLEAGLKASVDKVIVVRAGIDKCVRRIKKRSGLNKQEILKRMHLQMPLRKKLRMADFIIDNNGSMQKARKQVENIRRSLAANN
ncbi:MAG: dephospho-CoA kinase [Candidatus Omnitrophota bacterium]